MVDEQLTDGMTGKENAGKQIQGSYPKPSNGYTQRVSGGDTSLQDKSMNRERINGTLDEDYEGSMPFNKSEGE